VIWKSQIGNELQKLKSFKKQKGVRKLEDKLIEIMCNTLSIVLDAITRND